MATDSLITLAFLIFYIQGSPYVLYKNSIAVILNIPGSNQRLGMIVVLFQVSNLPIGVTYMHAILPYTV